MSTNTMICYGYRFLRMILAHIHRIPYNSPMFENFPFHCDCCFHKVEVPYILPAHARALAGVACIGYCPTSLAVFMTDYR